MTGGKKVPKQASKRLFPLLSLDFAILLLRAASKPAKNGGDTIGHVMINANPCAIADL
jgi:hypothetical protein